VRAKTGELVWFDPLTRRGPRRMKIGPRPNQLAIYDGPTDVAYVPLRLRDVVGDRPRSKVKWSRKSATGVRRTTRFVVAGWERMLSRPEVRIRFEADVATHKLVAKSRSPTAAGRLALSRDESRLYATGKLSLASRSWTWPQRK